MRLLHSTWTEIMTLTVAFRSIPLNGELMFAKEFMFVEKTARECGALELYDMVILYTIPYYIFFGMECC